jgi:precorrin-6x reductase
MLMLDMYLKRAMKGEIDLMGPAMAVQKEFMSIPDFGDQDTSVFGEEKKAIRNAKKAVLMTAGAAAQKYMQKLAHEQEILMNCADMITQIYLAESSVLRTEKLIAAKGEEAAKLQIAISKVYTFDAMDKINKAGKDAVMAFAEGDELRMMLLGIKRFTKIAPTNTKEARRLIADAMIEKNGFLY